MKKLKNKLNWAAAGLVSAFLLLTSALSCPAQVTSGPQGGGGGGTTLSAVTNAVQGMAGASGLNGAALTNVPTSTLLSFGLGQVLFDPGVDNSSSAGTTTMRQSGAGVVLDSGAIGSAWAPFGSNMSLVILDQTFFATTNWDPAAANQPHAMPVAQYTDGNHFRGAVGVDVLSNALHYADREGGSEIAQFLQITNVALKMNYPYRMYLAITNTGVAANTNVNMIFFDGLTGAQITNKIWQMSFFGTNGYQCDHTYAAAMVIMTNTVLTGDGVTLVTGGPQEWIAVNNTGSAQLYTGPLNAGVLTITNAATYRVDLSPVVMQDGEFTGTMQFNNSSGRPGVVARMSTAGFGYVFWYDGNNGQIRAGTLDNAGNYVEKSTTPAASLVINTNYAFTLNLHGSVMTFAIGNNQVSITDNSYNTAGYIGIMTRETTAKWSQLKVYSAVGDGNGQSTYLQNTNGIHSGTLKSGALNLTQLNLSAPASITVTASPFNYTNTDGYNEFVFISAGTISALAINGTTIYSVASDITVPLQPGEYVTATYTVAPTMRKKPY